MTNDVSDLEGFLARREESIKDFKDLVGQYGQVVLDKEGSLSGSLEEWKKRTECGFLASRVRNKKRLLDSKL